MLFNSFEFAVFLPIMFFACWYACGSSWRMQNVVLLAGSLVFYGWWDPRFLGLMLFSAVLDFTVSNLIHSTQHPVGRKALLGCSLVINFGILAVFKYCNFFISSLNDALALAGFSPATTSASIPSRPSVPPSTSTDDNCSPHAISSPGSPSSPSFPNLSPDLSKEQGTCCRSSSAAAASA
jgi:D-alanyl-lipoteichoic acid acyltransferase DltB (MBOAT superfamily)